MAVVTISSSEIMKITSLKKEQVLEGLNDIGMPTEESEGEMFVEVTPNRPDLFSIEGIARALNSFHGKKPTEYYAAKSDLAVKIEISAPKSRPYIVAALVKNVRMDEDALKSIMQLQEKLHDTVGRKRKKLAIGVHNADAVAFPLVYKGVKDASFVPLDFDKEMNVPAVLEKHPKGRAYAHIVNAPYPIVYDQKGVISFPPIINSERTRVTEKTRNLLVEITGTHLGMMNGALNIITCALADRGGEIIEVKVGKESYPKLAPLKMKLDVDKINKLLGTKLSAKQMLDCLLRLGWSNDGKSALVPPYRIDVSHYADIAEDVAIAHGYNDLDATMPDFFTPGSLSYSNEDIVHALVGMGFVEVVNYALTNKEKTAKISSGAEPLKIINPKTEEFTLIRTNVAVSLLDNIIVNKTKELPLKIFEIGRVYDSREKIHLAFAISDEVVDFARIRGVLQSVSQAMEMEFELKLSQNRLFISGRGAEVWHKNRKIGEIGEIAPDLLEQVGIENPVSICEIEIKKE